MRLILVLAVLLAALPARANIVYSYLGNPYTDISDSSLPAGTFDTSMLISGSFELANPIAPNTPLTDITADVLNFSFFNGRSTLTQASARLTTFFFVQTNAVGAISVWDVIIQQALPPSLLGEEISIATQNDSTGSLGLSGVTDRGQLAVCEPATIPRGLCILRADVASVDNRPGVWSSTVTGTPGTPVSEPATAGLALAALGCLAASTRRRRANLRQALR